MSLDAKQAEAVDSTARYILCDSKAGSGKTRTIAYRCKHLLDIGVKPEEIMVITFTNKAATEMEERITALTKQSSIMCGTFHGIGLKFMKEFYSELALESNFSIITPNDSEKKIKEFMKLEDADVVEKLKAAHIHRCYSAARNCNIELTQYLEDKKYRYCEIDAINSIISSFNLFKRMNDLVDFDDILDYFSNALSLPIAGPKIIGRFKHILVDEFQDVNYVQYQIVAKLKGRSNVLFAVGDPCQCIYEFRGSKLDYIVNFPKVFTSHVIRLDTNYRSTQEILDVGADVTHNVSRMNAFKGRGEKPVLKIVADEDYPSGQATDVIKQIIELKDNGTSLSEIAILVRSAFGTVYLEKELSNHNIPYILRAGFSFFEKTHVKDMVAVMSLLLGSKSTLFIDRALSLFKGMGPASVKKVIDAYREGTSPELVGFLRDSETLKLVSKKCQSSLLQLASILEELLAIPTLSQKIVRFMEIFYKGYLEKEFAKEAEECEDRLDDLRTFHLMSTMNKDMTDMEFLNSIMIDSSLNNKTKKSKRNEPAVVISTIHRAKGLEWDNVFICSFSSMGGKPCNAVEDVGYDVSPDERLAYVAITRARKKLVIYGLRSGIKQGMFERNHLSHVFKLIKQAKVEYLR